MAVKDSKFFLFKPLPLIATLTILQLLIGLLSVQLTFTQEESMWHYIGRNWFRHGLVPYTGGVDNKSPLIFAVFGLSDKLFGVNYWFPRVVATLVQSAGLYYLYKIAKHIAGIQSAILAATIYGLSLLWKTTGGAYVSFTETYAVAFIITAFYYQLTAQNVKNYFVSGFIAGFGFGFRFSACFGILAIFIAAVRKNKTGAAFFIIGVLSSVALVMLLLYWAGIDVKSLYINAFRDNFGAGSTTDHDFSWKLTKFMDSFFYAEIILFYPFIVAYFIISKRENFLTVWLVLEFIGINVLGIYARNHFKGVLPAMSLMSGLSLGYLAETYKVPFKAIIVVVWVAFFPKIIEPAAGLKQALHPAPDNSEKLCALPYVQPEENAEKKLGLWVKQHTYINEKVFVAGFGARVQAFSERISPTVYFNVTQTAIAKATLFHDLVTDKPAMMLVPEFGEYKLYVQDDIRTFIDSIAAADYRFERCMYGYGVYKLKK